MYERTLGAIYFISEIQFVLTEIILQMLKDTPSEWYVQNPDVQVGYA